MGKWADILIFLARQGAQVIARGLHEVRLQLNPPSSLAATVPRSRTYLSSISSILGLSLSRRCRFLPDVEATLGLADASRSRPRWDNGLL